MGVQITQQEFFAIRDYIKQHYGINLSDEKQSLIHTRLSPVIAEHGFSSFDEYFAFVQRDREAAVIFIDKVTTNHTYFMREPDHFDLLRDMALPWIDKKFAGQRDLRIWCAGCSSGEEAYTIQMVIKDYFNGRLGWNQEILATDLSTRVLRRAVAGTYTVDAVKPLPEIWRRKYFRQHDKYHLIVNDELRRDVTFRKLNFMSKLSFAKPFQVIFCRNVMIYFDIKTRTELIKKFYDCLEPDGFLFVGHSEALGSTNYFKPIGPAAYRKVIAD